MPPICVSCKLEMRCEKSDFLISDVHTVMFPETYWLGDLFRCPKCGHAIVTGTGIAMDLKQVDQLSDDDSMTFAHELSQLDTFSAQFKGD